MQGRELWQIGGCDALCYNDREAFCFRQEGQRWRSLFRSFFYKRGVSMMTDYEMLSIVIMIITLVVSLLINNRDKKSRDATQR
ncbi:MAG: hypothetical protein PUJ39_13265 [Eubacteriales bacterium]|nr:hypothetical protein [Eubacteriales bacterium]